MGITDPVVLVCQPGHDLPWYLMQGRETFYDEERYMRRWETWQEAVSWAQDELGVTPVDDRVREKTERAVEEWKAEDRQPKLL